MVESTVDKHYKKLYKLGAGSYGTAWLVERQNDNQKLAMKKVSLLNRTDEERRHAEQEAHNLKKLRHPNIVSFVDAFKKNDDLCTVMEYADAGDL